MIGTRLKRMRIARGLTQKELGEPRYTHAYVSTIEAGRRHPSRDALEHFATKLGVDVDELLTGRTPDLDVRLRLRLHEARVQISDGRFAEADEGLRHVVRQSKKFALPRLEAKAEEVRGLWLQRSGSPDEALEHYQRAEDLLRDEPPTARADVVDGMATCFAALGDVRYAVFLLRSLLDEIERASLRDPDALVRVHAGLVYFYLDLGLMQAAADSAAEAERLATRVDDPGRLAQMHMNVARQYLADGRIEDATASLQRAEDAYRQLGLVTEMGGAHLARGYLLSRQGELAKAQAELEQARDIFERTSNTKDLTRTLNELARRRPARRQGGRRSRAPRALDRAPRDERRPHPRVGTAPARHRPVRPRRPPAPRSTCGWRSSCTSAPSRRWVRRSRTARWATCCERTATSSEAPRPIDPASSRWNRCCSGAQTRMMGQVNVRETPGIFWTSSISLPRSSIVSASARTMTSYGPVTTWAS